MTQAAHGDIHGTIEGIPFDSSQLLDDPVSRNSTQSYFVQLADLAAYAAFRRHYPPPARPVQIVPKMMWSELGKLFWMLHSKSILLLDLGCWNRFMRLAQNTN